MKNNHSELNISLSNDEVSSEHFRSQAVDFAANGVQTLQRNEVVDMKSVCEENQNETSCYVKGQENCLQARFLVATKERNEWIETVSNLSAEVSDEMHIIKQLLNSFDINNQECPKNIDEGVERSSIYHKQHVDIGSISVITDKELDKDSLNESRDHSSDSTLGDADMHFEQVLESDVESDHDHQDKTDSTNCFCTLCNFLFSNSEILRIHFKNNHSKSELCKLSLPEHAVSRENFKRKAAVFKDNKTKTLQIESNNAGEVMKPKCSVDLTHK